MIFPIMENTRPHPTYLKYSGNFPQQINHVSVTALKSNNAGVMFHKLFLSLKDCTSDFRRCKKNNF